MKNNLNPTAVAALRMERQHLTRRAGLAEYDALYRDAQPGQCVYWNGFGDPPSMSFRADFDDMEYNRARQRRRDLIKGRFQGGGVGWIMPADLELFAGAYRKPLERETPVQRRVLELFEHEGPMTIQYIKELTGLLVREITPALHRLQEAFLIYEDQYDGEWDRAWYLFPEMFPDANLTRYTRAEALEILLRRFAYRAAEFSAPMAKSFYRVPDKDIKAALTALVGGGVLTECADGYLLTDDLAAAQTFSGAPPRSVFALHRNDFLVKANKHTLDTRYLRTGCDALQYLLIDGEFHGAAVGHFKNGPYIVEDVLLDLPDADVFTRRDEILAAVRAVNDPERSPVQRYAGKKL
ncbi:MAG: hypothetical protein LBT36_03310 [Oscillospiraceae bacterium]|jgi:hypothetical protein|nr:hypothetical protein [Oscillospiraceae bacterium]